MSSADRGPLGWLRKNYSRGRVIGVGVALLAVPTVFTVFPGLTDWNPWVRAAVVLAWGVAAVATVIGATMRDEAVQALSDDRRAQLKNLRRIAYAEIIEALLRSGTKGIPDQYEFTVYVFDEQEGALVPIWPLIEFRDDPDPRVFAPGKGATGTAWRDERMILVTGTEVCNAKYDLTDDQRRYFKDYRVAAAVPIMEDATTPFGVLTVLGKKDDGFFSDNGPGRSNLFVLADVIGVVLKVIPDADDLP